jgi:hypothetical protein
MFQNMARPSTFSDTLQKSTSLTNAATMLDQRWQPSGESLIKAGERIRWRIF